MSKWNVNRLKEALSKYNKTQAELAIFMEVHPRTVSSWCTNDFQPDYVKLFKIADFFGVEPGELLTRRKDFKQIEKTRKRGGLKRTVPKKKK